MSGRATVLVVSVLAACGATDAHAAAVTVGSPLTASFAPESAGGPGTLVNTALGEPGATLASPFAGKLVRWRVVGSGTFALAVLRPRGDGTFVRVAATPPFVASGSATVTASLPVAAGDTVALDSRDAGDSIGIASVAGSTLERSDGDRENDTEAAFNADVLRVPAIDPVPTAAPGASVVITGTDLAETSAVTFGTAGASFTVDSDTRLTAVVPPRSGARSTRVHVTTPAGSATQPFSYPAVSPAVPPRVIPAQTPRRLSFVGTPTATSRGVRARVRCSGMRYGVCTFAAKLTTLVRGRRVAIGARLSKLAVGRTTTLTVPLNATGRRLLLRRGRLAVTLRASYAVSGRRGRTPALAVVLRRRR